MIAAVMHSFPNIFTSDAICMIEASEEIGNLIAVICNLISVLEAGKHIEGVHSH
jgi:type II secretory pathway component PulF